MNDRDGRDTHDMSKTSEKLQSLLGICQMMSSEHDLAALLDLVAREAATLMEADRASIFLLDRDANELWSQVAIGIEPIRFDADKGIAGAVIRTGEVINVADARSDERFYGDIDAVMGYTTERLLAVPMRNHGGEIIGAFEVLNKHAGPFDADDEELLKALASQAAVAFETAQHIQELRWHRDRLQVQNLQLLREVEERFSTKHIIGNSEKLRHMRDLIDQISDSSVNVLITGESGTGKELCARAIHYGSPRAGNPLVALNCAALPDTLLESELFGIEKGVATGVERRPGKFQEADTGTLFLDEIGDLSLTAQAKILRALQEGVIERVGGRGSVLVDVRVLAATNKNLEREIAEGAFREDLYYRLKVIHLTVPSLTEIPDDIPMLAAYFLARYCREMNREPKRFAPDALHCLKRYRWPGNVRELENEIKRIVVLTRRRVIGAGDLSEAIREVGRSAAGGAPLPDEDGLKERVEALEKRLIREALRDHGGNRTRTAAALGLSRQGLIKKLKRYGFMK